jgi:hypothetical protein
MFRDTVSLGGAIALGWLLGTATPAQAQGVASSFDQLGSRVGVGDWVIVTDAAGRETAGTIAALSAAGMTLTVNGVRTDFLERDIDQVSQRDSRWNGTLWGLAAGAAVGVALEKSLVDEYGRDEIGVGSAVLPLAAIGSGIGFAVDALIKGRRLVYDRSPALPGRPALSLVWNRRQKGIRVTLLF